MSSIALDGTRSSHRWAEPPGNFDTLNCRAIYPSGNEWGIPDLPATNRIPARLVAYSDRRQVESAEPDSAIHFFLDDYRFEPVWTNPVRALSRIRRVGFALTPDFSMWRDMPLAMQLWQVYRSRWCGAWMAEQGGVDVVPTLSWSTVDSYPFAFAAVATGSVVAVSTVGVRNAMDKELFAAGYAEMVARLSPSLVLIYGSPPTEQVLGLSEYRIYPTRWN